ncbi:MAG: hypothetical protein VCC04_12330, partial [Myxococcota bacterium]
MSRRVDQSDQLTARVAIRLIGRALRYVKPFRFDFSVKWGLVFFSFMPMLILPWPGRILVDHVIQGI